MYDLDVMKLSLQSPTVQFFLDSGVTVSEQSCLQLFCYPLFHYITWVKGQGSGRASCVYTLLTMCINMQNKICDFSRTKVPLRRKQNFKNTPEM